jgi:hypothetical protein
MDDREAKDFLFPFIAAIVFFLLMTILAGSYADALRNISAEAIKRGHAEYSVDEYGNTEWRWKE